FSLDVPFEQLKPAHQRVILHGSGDAWIPLEDRAGKGSRRTRSSHDTRFQYKGLFPAIDEASRVSFVYRHKLDHLVSEVPCTACGGSRLRGDAAAVRFEGETIGATCGRPLGQTLTFIQNLKLSKPQQQVAGELLREIRNRLQFLV